MPSTWNEKLAYILSVDDKGFNFNGSLAQIELVNNAIIDMLSGVDEMYSDMIGLASALETEMANVSTLLDGDTAVIDRYTDAIIELSTQVPESAVNLSQGLYQVISAGVDASQAMQVLETSSRAAVAGMSDTYTGVDAITTILNAYSMDASRAEEVSDMLFQTVRLGKTTFGELSGYVGTFATNAASLGIELSDVSAAMATMTKSGLKTARSATALDAIMREISKKGEIVKLFKQAGYESSEMALKTLGLQGAIKLAGDQAKKTGVKFNQLWGEEALRGATILNQNFEMAKKDLDAMALASGSTSLAYEKAVDTLENAEQRRINAYEALLTKMGQDVLPLHKKYNEMLTGIYGSLAKLPASQRMVMTGMLGMARATSGIVQFSGKWMRNVASIKEGYMALAPILAKIKALKTGEELAKGANEAADALKGATGGAKSLKGMLGKAGLGAAIAFTATQLIALGGAIMEFNAAKKEMLASQKATEEAFTDMTGGKTEAEKAALMIGNLKKLEEILAEKLTGSERAQKAKADAINKYIDQLDARTIAEIRATGLELNSIEDIRRLRELGSAQQAIENQKAHEQHLQRQADQAKELEDAVKNGETKTQIIEKLVAQYKALGGSYTLAKEWETLDDKKLKKMIDGLELKITQIKEKHVKDRETRLAKLSAKNRQTEYRMELEELKRSTIDKTDLQITEAERHWSREKQLATGNMTRQKEIDADYGEVLKELYAQREVQQEAYYTAIRTQIEETRQAEWDAFSEFQKDEAIKEQFEKETQLKLDDLDIKANDEKLERGRTLNEKLKDLAAENYEVQEETSNAIIELYRTMGTEAGRAFGETKSLKEAMKAALLVKLEALKADLQLKYALITAEDVTTKGFAGLATASIKIAALEGLFALASNAVASFDDGGIPTTAGVATVHPTDVIVNPTTDNPMMTALVDRITEAMGGQMGTVELTMDGEKMGEANIGHINRRNRQLKNGRDVFDESRFN